MSLQESVNKAIQKISDGKERQILEKVKKCQNEITVQRVKCDKEIYEIEKSYLKTVEPYIKERNRIIQTLPQFWSKTLVNHPLLTTVFEPGEKDVIKYLTGFEIEDNPHNPDYFKVHFYFDAYNPYFENRLLTKIFSEEGSASTTIKWRSDQSFSKTSGHEDWEYDELGLKQKGFFRWFSDPEEQYCDPIADILRSHIWYDPLEFYYEDEFWDAK